MPSAFVISTPKFTAGILSHSSRGLRFDAAHVKVCSLQNRIFKTPEAALHAVEKLVGPNSARRSEPAVSYRPLF